MSETVIDGQYYAVAKPKSMAERLVIAARDRIYADFIAMTAPTPDATIVDVGVSDTITDAANVLQRAYPHPERITALGLGSGVQFQAAYPKVAYRQIEPNRRLPFDDGHFDIATANAVLEHVGSRDHQRAFIDELARIARNVFITVPHRFFPVEHHTGLPLVHFNDASFRFACARTGNAQWADETNLILMSRRHLRDLARDHQGARVGTTGLRLGPFSSNLYLFITR